MQPHPLIARITLAAACLTLAGCTYTVDVRNTTTQPVFVQLLQIDPVQPDWVLASERVAPGAYAKLGPTRVPFERVVVQAGNQTQKSVDARYKLTAGHTDLDVGQRPGEDGRDEIIFTLERRTK